MKTLTAPEFALSSSECNRLMISQGVVSSVGAACTCRSSSSDDVESIRTCAAVGVEYEKTRNRTCVDVPVKNVKQHGCKIKILTDDFERKFQQMVPLEDSFR
eukprot:m.562215 g.562215  ORF g.562215 m.562215 type:complete len:102 (+) comp57799_c0_seq5:1109-1414(+)